MGLIWNRNSPAFLGIELNAGRRGLAFSRLEAEGAVLPAAVEGVKAPFYYLAEDGPLMARVPSARYLRVILIVPCGPSSTTL